MVKCKDCKYWDNSENYCVVSKEHQKQYGSCNSTKFIYSGLDELSEKGTDLLYYADYEGYAAGFAVGADFGCIHGIKKEVP